MKNHRLRLITLTGGLLLTGTAFAQPAYPAKPIRLIVGFAAGGATDFLARIVAQQLTQQLGQSVTVDNRPGAGGAIGAELGARAAPDGYTLTAGSSGAFSVTPHLVAKLSYDPVRDFAPVGMYSTFPYVVLVHPSVPVKSIKELVALAKAQPGKLNFGSAGNASGNHLAVEQFMSIAGVKLIHVPYKGGALALTALMSGEIDITFDPMITTMQQLKSGRIRTLAVSTPKRAVQLPDLPTMNEAGIKGYDATNWGGILVPAATPRPIIDRLNTAINQGLSRTDVRERMRSLGAEPLTGTPEELGELVKRELARNAKIIKDAGLRAE
jgi:tripartite-type tricarboxylate transporter receptor subunit TctC